MLTSSHLGAINELIPICYHFINSLNEEFRGTYYITDKIVIVIKIHSRMKLHIHPVR